MQFHSGQHSPQPVSLNFQHTSSLSKLLSTFLLLLLMATLTACGPEAARKKAIEEQFSIAQAAQASGDYSLAGQEYVALAELTPATLEDGSPAPARQDYLLTAAEMHLKAEESLAARRALVQLDRQQLAEGDQLRFDLINANIARLDERHDQVITALQPVSLNTLSEDQQRMIWQYRIDAYDGLEQAIEAARARAQADHLLPEAEQTQNRESIWQAVQSLSESDLTSVDRSEPVFAGWLALSEIARRSLYNEEQFKTDLNSWRLRNPDHAAETPIIESLLETSNKLGKKISTIALLLPQDGRFAQVGAAIRDGFLSAWYGDNQRVDQPMVQVYDANALNVQAVYRRAVEDGADLIVGPLEKEAIQQLISLDSLPVPTLALNQIDPLAETEQVQKHIQDNALYQFGLPPEDEASQVANEALEQGMRYALAITPEGSWGDRLFESFQTAFTEGDGTILKHVVIPADSSDYSDLIKEMLNVELSQARYKALEADLKRQIKFEPRARKDMDFVFIAAQPVQARQIRPQLLFHRSSQTPVLATSHVYGLPLRDEPDLDMEGVSFADMPWMLMQSKRDRETPLSMQNNWPDHNAVFLRLFALGMDAYQIGPQLGRLRYEEDASLQGQSGKLGVNNLGVVERELSWAQFKNGVPVSRDQLPAPLIPLHADAEEVDNE